MTTEYKVRVPATLAAELAWTAEAVGLPPEKYIGQVVEAWGADLRLARLEDVAQKAT